MFDLDLFQAYRGGSAPYPNVFRLDRNHDVGDDIVHATLVSLNTRHCTLSALSETRDHV